LLFREPKTGPLWGNCEIYGTMGSSLNCDPIKQLPKHILYLIDSNNYHRGKYMSLFEVKCPICKGTLWIDPASGKVVDHKTIDQQKTSFEDFLKNRNKGTAWDEKFQKAKEEEKKRKTEIEANFKKAKESPEEGLPEQMKSPLDWD
jgi:hypothetical protein